MILTQIVQSAFSNACCQSVYCLLLSKIVNWDAMSQFRCYWKLSNISGMIYSRLFVHTKKSYELTSLYLFKNIRNWLYAVLLSAAAVPSMYFVKNVTWNQTWFLSHRVLRWSMRPWLVEMYSTKSLESVKHGIYTPSSHPADTKRPHSFYGCGHSFLSCK